MADLMQAWLLTLSPTTGCRWHARTHVDRLVLPQTGLSNREARHLRSAAVLAANGQWPSAVNVLDRHLMSDPHDLAGHQCAMRLDGYLGRFHRVAARSARVAAVLVERTSRTTASCCLFMDLVSRNSVIMRAREDVSRAAAEREPYGYWPHHAVSHVLEMTGRPDRKVSTWMDEPLAVLVRCQVQQPCPHLVAQSAVSYRTRAIRGSARDL